MQRDPINKASLIRYTATDLGIQTKLFVYDDADRFLVPCRFDIGSRALERMWQEHRERLADIDTMLPPWQG